MRPAQAARVLLPGTWASTPFLFLILLYANCVQMSIRILHEFLLFSMDKTLKTIVQTG